MNYVLVINAAISLIMGSALVLVWRRDPTQAFTRYIGWANLVQLLVPLTFLVKVRGDPFVDTIGNLALMVIAAGYSTLLLIGTAHLANRPLGHKLAWPILLTLALVNTAAVGLAGLRLGQASMATINTMLGVVCTYWLWNAGSTRYSSEKLVGPLLVLLGLIQFIYVVYQDAGTALLATLGALLRVMLGLVLLYAALDRGALATRRLQNRFERLTERSPQGILICQGSDSIVYANPACLAIYGVKSLAELQVATVAQTIPEAERKAVGRLLDQIQRGQKDDTGYEAQRHRVDGTPMWLRLHYFRTEWDGSPAVQVLISDETERYYASQALIYQALHDELTGLPNRTALIKSLRNRCNPAQPMQSAQHFVLVLMNLDRFKLFNEAHGHSMGDDVLRAMGQALRASMDPACEVMRLSGDEFALVCSSEDDRDTAVDLVTRVRQLLGRPLKVAHQELFLDASLGIALYPGSAHDAESLLRAANAAMHVAKRTPGTSYRLAEKAFERGSSNTLEQEQALRAGIERGEFQLVYQPKVNAHSGRLTSFEALARWNRPGVGVVSPVEFIAVAERTGLIGALGTHLLKQACEQIAHWQSRFESCVPVAVNVSPLQLLDPRFPELVAQILRASGVDSQWLTLEITESSAVQNLEQTTVQIEQLRSMGVHVAMDDFGTGFSSLNMLRSLRLHTVKIDRGLIDPLPNPQAIAVVRAICQLADALDLHVVAEGVETTAQTIAARDAGCAELQGFLYAQPLSVQDAEGWLERFAERWSETLEMPLQSGKLGE
ncbi:putative bifunctional diguanylate cyclase/phosphodiesterase [Candidatus Aalborgicola defluviihabitans]|uniref:putative bifunctional diguanylate cyclase/phosphodiesterase n=1 Tax=Candidatus Aalborgicola defluviihabitans TaxID=3386187 RepID=UPI001D61A275|nr:EAL domain-containing protein [Burkholderiales bacterium]MBK7312345.1 EAL domain-containing protein [Burkholderiales bacterium]